MLGGTASKELLTADFADDTDGEREARKRGAFGFFIRVLRVIRG